MAQVWQRLADQKTAEEPEGKKTHPKE
jgi:hypothetical protein